MVAAAVTPRVPDPRSFRPMPLPRRLPGHSLRLASAVLVLAAVAACVPRAPDLLTSGACLAPDEVTDADGDFRRHPELFGPERCVRQTSFREGGRTWTVQTVRNTARAGPLWVLPHDNEQAAVDTAVYALARYGGTAVLVETGGRRDNGATDPNRAFDAGRSRCTAGAPASRYVAAMLGSRSRGAPVIALHTNAPGIAGRRGSGSVSIRAPGKAGTAYPGIGASGGLASPDSLVITAVSGPTPDGRTAALVADLTGAGVNVLVETTSSAATDCSLSHYAALNGVRPYLNIEVVDGDSATQRRILDIVMGALGE